MHDGCDSAVNKEVLPLVKARMDLEGVGPSGQVGERGRQRPYDLTHMWNLKNKASKEIQQHRDRLKDTQNKSGFASAGARQTWLWG